MFAFCKANSGKLQYGSAGIGAPTHLAAEMFKSRVGFDMTHVPYKGDSAAIMDVVSGTVDMSFSTVSATISLIRGGQAAADRDDRAGALAVLPDMPTPRRVGAQGLQRRAAGSACSRRRTRPIR